MSEGRGWVGEWLWSKGIALFLRERGEGGYWFAGGKWWWDILYCVENNAVSEVTQGCT